jgi:hypothetical protein
MSLLCLGKAPTPPPKEGVGSAEQSAGVKVGGVAVEGAARCTLADSMAPTNSIRTPLMERRLL